MTDLEKKRENEKSRFQHLDYIQVLEKEINQEDL